MPGVKQDCSPSATAEHQRRAQPRRSASDDDYVEKIIFIHRIALARRDSATAYLRPYLNSAALAGAIKPERTKCVWSD